MFITRNLAPVIISGAKQVPIIAIIGPRQSGKSTLAKELFKNHVYLDMQDAQLFEFANSDPKGFLQTYHNKHGIIIDEAQYAPKLFPQLKVEADKNPKPGYFILSGSQNFLLFEKISESLAGRIYFYTLLPLSIKELKTADLLAKRAEDQVLKGFYPRIYQPQIDFAEYYRNYISTYVERDIRSLRNIDNILVFKRFMQLCALAVGTTVNFSELARDAGINVATAKKWLSLLESSFVLFLLPSYHDNLGKRITKAPKLYFYDVGLAAALIEIDKEILLKKRNLYGMLFENMVIVDILKNLYARNVRPTITFFRDSNQREIDLILEKGGTITPLEIKASESMQNSFFDTLLWFKKEIHKTKKPIVVYGGDHNQIRSIGNVFSWKNTDKIKV